MTVCFRHVTYAFQRESTLYSCLNVKELLARGRREIRSLSDCNQTRTQKHLVRKRTLNHLAKLVLLGKWLSVRLRTKQFWVRVQLYVLCFGSLGNVQKHCSKMVRKIYKNREEAKNILKWCSIFIIMGANHTREIGLRGYYCDIATVNL